MIIFIVLFISDVFLTPKLGGHTKTFYEVIVGTTTKASADSSIGADYAAVPISRNKKPKKVYGKHNGSAVSISGKKKPKKIYGKHNGSDYVAIYYDDAESIIEDRKRKAEGGTDYGANSDQIDIEQADKAVLDLVFDSSEYLDTYSREAGADYGNSQNGQVKRKVGQAKKKNIPKKGKQGKRNGAQMDQSNNGIPRLWRDEKGPRRRGGKRPKNRKGGEAKISGGPDTVKHPGIHPRIVHGKGNGVGGKGNGVGGRVKGVHGQGKGVHTQGHMADWAEAS